MGMAYVLLSVRIDIGAKARLRNKNTLLGRVLNKYDAKKMV